MAHKILCRVDGHMVRARTEDGEPIVAGTVEHWEMDTELGEEWGDLAVRVTWTGAGEAVTQDFEPTMEVPAEVIADSGRLRLSFVGVGPDGIEIVRTRYMSIGIEVAPCGADLGAEAREKAEDIVHAAQRNLADLSQHVADAGAVVERAQQAVGDAVRAAETANAATGTATHSAAMADAAKIDAQSAATKATNAARLATAAQTAAHQAAGNADASAANADRTASDLRAAAERGDFDGVSPTATVSKSGRTATITVTDAHGTTAAQVLDGEPGSDYVLTDDDKAEIAEQAADGLQPAITALDGRVTELEEHGTGGGVTDVTLAGTSCVVDGVAEIPTASGAAWGLARPYNGLNFYGITAGEQGFFIEKSSNTDIDARTQAYRPIVPNNLDRAVKAAMTDGKGAAWTQAERAACRARIGDAPWELIETIVLTEDVASIVREKTPNGEDYDFRELLVFLDIEAASGAAHPSISINYSRAGFISNGINTTRRLNNFFSAVVGGRILSFNTSASSQLYTSTSYVGRFGGLMRYEADGIKRLDISKEGTANFPAGSTITIYARRW